jgi:hypothetical protein
MSSTRLRAHLVLPTVLVALALPLTSVGPVAARPAADHVPKAKHRVLGSHVTNHHTHMETWIVGFYPYRRRVRIHGHLHTKRFYGLRVSAQHCDRRHCWGPTVGGKLRSPHQPGRPLPGHGRSAPDRAGRGPQGDFCLPGSTVCAAPWNWLAAFVDRLQRELVRRFVDPCAQGSIGGGGVVAVKDLAARILFEGGVITAARAGSAFEGPPGIALGALAGCMTRFGAQGVHTVTALLHHLNPFDRTGRHG